MKSPDILIATELVVGAFEKLEVFYCIPELDVTEEVRQLGRVLVSGGPIPKGSESGSVRNLENCARYREW